MSQIHDLNQLCGVTVVKWQRRYWESERQIFRHSLPTILTENAFPSKKLLVSPYAESDSVWPFTQQASHVMVKFLVKGSTYFCSLIQILTCKFGATAAIVVLVDLCLTQSSHFHVLVFWCYQLFVSACNIMNLCFWGFKKFKGQSCSRLLASMEWTDFLYLICLKTQLCSQAEILARKKRISQLFKNNYIFIAKQLKWKLRMESLIKQYLMKSDQLSSSLCKLWFKIYCQLEKKKK